VRALVVLAASLVLVAAACGGTSEESAQPEPVARQAPEIEGVTIDGKSLSLADFRGRPVFVNVWSSW
jgi:uncharacterized lipoprotein YajG